MRVACIAYRSIYSSLSSHRPRFTFLSIRFRSLYIYVFKENRRLVADLRKKQRASCIYLLGMANGYRNMNVKCETKEKQRTIKKTMLAQKFN